RQLARAVEKEKIGAADAEAALGRIASVGGTDAFAPCDLVIEAATEREAIKRQIFETVGKVLGPQAILASNTSSIPITRLAQAAPDAGR
ncbi:3-hydroxyacyl-CoA dehydrogenase NAD-binding domain-containing protein, partial [Marinobacter sp. 71-i]